MPQLDKNQVTFTVCHFLPPVDRRVSVWVLRGSYSSAPQVVEGRHLSVDTHQALWTWDVGPNPTGCLKNYLPTPLQCLFRAWGGSARLWASLVEC